MDGINHPSASEPARAEEVSPTLDAVARLTAASLT